MNLLRLLSVALLLTVIAPPSHAQDSVLDIEAAYRKHDYVRARALLLPLAQQGHSQAQYNLGVLYRDGQGGPIDYDAAAAWFRAAARSGYAPAQNNLGSLYLEGRGASIDYVMAYFWFERARNGSLSEVIRTAVESNLTYVMSLMTPEQIAEARRLARQAS